MEPLDKPSNLKIAKHYIINALKFYELNNEKITPIIFIVLLFTGLLGGVITEAAYKLDDKSLYTIYNLIVIFILNVASVVYLHVYITELKGQAATLKQSIRIVFKKIFKIIVAYFIFTFIISLGILLLIIPALIFYHMFMFNVCYLVDKNIKIKDAFKASKRITTGKKMEIFAIFVLFNLLIFFPLFITLIMASNSGNSLVLSFVLTFFSSIITLMQQRLISMIYFDLEYGQK